MFKLVIFVGMLPLLSQGKVFRFDYEYIEPADGWMKLHVIPSTWREARMRCQAEGAVIASPLNSQLKKSLISFVLRQKNNVPTTIFTGVHASFSKGDYTSLEGVPLTRIPVTWAPGEPDNFENRESCLALVTDGSGSMSDVKCDDVLPYVCYKKFTQLTMNVCGTTDPGYQLDPRTGSCYKFHRRGLVWHQGFMTCLAEGAYLAIVNNEVEANVLKDIFQKNPDETIKATDRGAVGVGFHDWGEHMTFMTIHGDTLENNYNVWHHGEPGNSSWERIGDLGEFCGSVYKYKVQLNDKYCNLPTPFICEKNLESLI